MWAWICGERSERIPAVKDLYLCLSLVSSSPSLNILLCCLFSILSYTYQPLLTCQVNTIDYLVTVALNNFDKGQIVMARPLVRASPKQQVFGVSDM